MGIAPQNRLARVQFYEDHNAPWTANTAAIGLLSSDVTETAAKAAAARAAYDNQQSALQASKAATEAFYNAVAALSVQGDLVIKKIETKAKQTGNPGVYSLAQIPAPATPTPKGPPGTPFGFKVEVLNTGALSLKWKNSNGSGCLYLIYRKLGETGALENLGGVGERKFVDDTLPAGTTQVEYQIQAARPSGTSDWAYFTVRLGMQQGQTVATVTAGHATKIAA